METLNDTNKIKPTNDKVVTIEYLREGYKKVVEAIYNKEKDNK